jgi:long-subunit fatty acid transport protein
MIRWVGALVLLASLTDAPATGAPLVETRVGGAGLVGPASHHPASVHYNPAALWLDAHRSAHFFLDGTVRLGHGQSQRRPVDVLTGNTADNGSTLRQFEQEDRLTAFPHFFFAFNSNLGTRSVVLGLTAYTPTAENTSLLQGSSSGWFDPAAQGPGRYHGTDLTLWHFHGALAAAYRVADTFIIGVSTSLVYGDLNFGFVRDTALEGGKKLGPGEYVALDECGGGKACDYESNAAAEAIRVSGTSWGVAFSAGVLVRPLPSLVFGLAYLSRVFGVESEEITAKGEAWVRRSSAAMASASSLGLDRDMSGRGTVSYNLPDMVNFGTTWHLSERTLLNLQLRWINFVAHDQLKIRLTGSAFNREPLTPDRIIHHRGFQDVVAVQLAGRYWLRPDKLQLQGGVMVESAAVPSEAVTNLTVDGTKVDIFVAAAWRLSRLLTLRAGYSLALFPAVEVDAPLFDPSAMVTCVDASYDVDLRECKHASAGAGLATNGGDYTLITHRLGLSLEVHVQ